MAILLAAAAPASAVLTWSQATAVAAWPGRYTHESVVLNNRMWVMGGYASGYKNDVWYSTNGSDWLQAAASAPWPARVDFTSAVFDSRMWVMGGSSTPTYNDVWSSTDGVNWVVATGSAGWSPRTSLIAGVFDGRMWVMGGSPGGSTKLNDVWYSTNGAAWTRATSSPGWSPRHSLSCSTFDGRMWIIGGNDGAFLSDVWYTTNGANWTRANAGVTSGWYSHTSLVADGKLWVLGGYSGTASVNDVWYTTDGVSWTKDSPQPGWIGRYTHTSVVYDSKLWVMGGSGSLTDVWYGAFAPVCTAPSITTPPASQTACSGGTVTFSVTAAGTAPLTYQWRKNSSAIGGATASSYTLSPVAVGDAAAYDVVVTNACGSATGGPATLTVNTSPVITLPPSNQVISNCTPATFTVTATGGSLSYQWRRNGTTLSDGGHISGATAVTLTIQPVGSSDAGNYDVVLSNPCGTTTSQTANLTLVFGDRTDCNDDGVPDDCEGGGPAQWIGASGGLFTTALNWSPTGVPGNMGTALLSNTTAGANACILDAPGETAVCNIRIESSGGRQTLLVDAGSGLRCNWGLTVLSGGMLQAMAGASVLIDGGNVTQAGELEVHTTAVLAFDAALTNSAGGRITLWDGSLSSAGLTNQALAQIRGFGTIDGSVTNDGTIVAVANMQIVGNLTNNGTVTIQNGVLTVTGTLSGSGTIIGGFGGRNGDEAGMLVRGDFDLAANDFRRLDLASTTVQMSGNPADGPQNMEALAADVGGRSIRLPDRALFSIGTLRIGPTATTVRLVDRHDNSPGSGPEALYVEHLVLDPGVTLDLAGLSLYYATMKSVDPLDPDRGVRVIDTVGGGGLHRLGGSSQAVRPQSNRSSVSR